MAVVGVGIDVVDVARLARVLSRTPSVADRVFADGERAAADLADVPVRRLAARFAAKEAAAKAIGVPGAVRWREIEVVTGAEGRPLLRVTGHTAELASRCGIRTWHVSLTHDAGVAMAVVVAES